MDTARATPQIFSETGLDLVFRCEDIPRIEYMDLLEIYRCLSDETRLRILHLLTHRPLCVCHFQKLLDLPQVTVSKHLAYLRKRKVVEAHRRGQWMIYALPGKPPRELDLQLQCLRECLQKNETCRADLRRLRQLRPECAWVPEALESSRSVPVNRKETRNPAFSPDP